MNGLHVLVVEDEFVLREDIAAFLRECGCTVHEAYCAEQATAICRAGLRVDVLFTDIHLNGSANGWEVAKFFRAAHPTVGVVYTSGKPVDQAQCVPDSLFFTKPYSRADILTACRRLLA
jgi:CheY-like chemotaxis protein